MTDTESKTTHKLPTPVYAAAGISETPTVASYSVESNPPRRLVSLNHSSRPFSVAQSHSL